MLVPAKKVRHCIIMTMNEHTRIERRKRCGEKSGNNPILKVMIDGYSYYIESVSYTHLTLPTT